MEQASIKHIWLQPGELAFLIEHYGIAIEKRSPLISLPVFNRWPEQRPVSYLMEDLQSKLSDEQAKQYLRALVSSTSMIQIKQGYHRKPVSSSFAFKAAPEGEILLLKTRPDTGVELIFPFSLQTLTDQLCEPMEHISNLGFSQDYLSPLAPSGLAALLALADHFNEVYPYPDPNWIPNRPLIFTLKSWHERLIKGRNAAIHESLLAAYINLTGISLPEVNLEDLEFWLLAFINDLYIGMEDDRQLPGDADAEYFVAEDLLVILRCLAWWDLTLALEKIPVGAQGAKQALTFLQASVLWQFVPTHPEGLLIAPQIINGWLLKERVSEFLDHMLAAGLAEDPELTGDHRPVKIERQVSPQPQAADKTVVAQPSVAKPRPKPATSSASPPAAPIQPKTSTPSRPSSARVCSNCGTQLSPTAKFCKTCGLKVDDVPSPVNVCKQCGQPIRTGAAFCKNCGFRVN